MCIIHTRRGFTTRNPADPGCTQPHRAQLRRTSPAGTAPEAAPAATPVRTHTSPSNTIRGRGPLRAAQLRVTVPLCVRNRSCWGEARPFRSPAEPPSPAPRSAAGRASSSQPARIGPAWLFSLGPGTARSQQGSARTARSRETPAPGRQPGDLPTSSPGPSPQHSGSPRPLGSQPLPRRPSAFPQPTGRSLPREPLAAP